MSLRWNVPAAGDEKTVLRTFSIDFTGSVDAALQTITGLASCTANCDFCDATRPFPVVLTRE